MVKKQVTHISSELMAKVRSAEFVSNSLSAGLKNRLDRYQKSLSVTTGDGDRRMFDSEAAKLIMKYAYSPSDVKKQLKYLRDLKNDEGITFRRNYKRYDKINDTLKLFSQPSYTSFRWNEHYQCALKWLKSQFENEHLKPLRYASDDDIIRAFPKEDAHSGFTYLLTGKKNKGENKEGIYNEYLKLAEYAKVNGTFSRPEMIAFRKQASGEFDDDGKQTGTFKTKVRLVHMVDELQLAFEIQYFRPIQELLAQKSWYTGGKDRPTIDTILKTDLTECRYFSSIDYSSFDQTIPPWLLEDVWRAVTSALDLNEDDKLLLEAVIHDAIHKDIIINEGILHSDVGLSSGLFFTNGGGTCMNAVIAVTYLFSKMFRTHDFRLLICGDDNVICTNKPISLEDLASYVKKNFGMNVKTDDKTNQGMYPKDNPKFLSTYWFPSGQYRHPHLLLSRLCYPEKFREYTSEVGPEAVLWCYIQTYQLGMAELMNITQFLADYEYSINKIKKEANRWMPGYWGYARQYLWTRDFAS
jgi:hypothetical protein